MTVINTRAEVWGKLPSLKSLIEEGKTPVFYTSSGIPGQMPEDHKAKIAELEAQGEEEDLKVIAVMDDRNALGNMICFIFVSSEYEPWLISETEVGFYAWVNNKTYDIQEAGSLAVKEIQGCLKRTM